MRHLNKQDEDSFKLGTHFLSSAGVPKSTSHTDLTAQILHNTGKSNTMNLEHWDVLMPKKRSNTKIKLDYAPILLEPIYLSLTLLVQIGDDWN